MNDFGIVLLWLMAQVTLLCAATMLVYSLARTRWLAAGGSALLTGVLLSVVLTIAMFSPWPRWSFESVGALESETTAIAEETVDVGAAPAVGDASPTSDGPPAAPSREVTLEPTMQVAWKAFVDGLQSELQRPAAQTGMSWANWLALGLCVCLALGALRLAVGWAMVRRCLWRSHPIENAALQENTDVLQAALSSRRSVELRETIDLDTAATVGWRRPVILLPRSWRKWTPAERNAVLAHELAHIKAGDCKAWMAAQVGLLLHYYHPLMHWLTRRLRLEQELAADALAAQLTGSSKHYLTTLAELAVRQPDRPVAWPARAFLPSPGTLHRRIEMLRDKRGPLPRPSNRRRYAVIGTIVVAAFVVAGLRPGANVPVLAQGDAAESPQSLSLEYVANDVHIVAAIRPAELATHSALQGLVESVNQNMIPQDSHLHVEDIQQVVVSVAKEDATPGGQRSLNLEMLEIRTKGPQDFTGWTGGKYKLVESWDDLNSQGSHSTVAYQPNDHTLLMGYAGQIAKVTKQGQSPANGGPAWMKKADALRDAPLMFALNVAKVRPLLAEEFERRPNAVSGMFVPLWKNTDIVMGSVTLQDQAEVKVVGLAPDEEAAETLAQTATAMIPLARGLLETARVQINDAPDELQGSLRDSVNVAATAMRQLKVEQDGQQVTVSTHGENQALATLLTALVPAVTQARDAAQRTMSMNNMRQITIGLHIYSDVHGHLPPPVLMGPDGKTPYSWRVAILPYLEQQALYDLYDFSQPWDSEANRRVLETMPVTYRHPKDESGKSYTSYFAVVGENTMFGPRDGDGIKFSEVTDGMSATILLVEAKRDIPWTKPEDIPFDGQEIPEFGGWFDGLFAVTLGDGSGRLISQSIDPEVLKKLLICNDGETITNF